MKIAPQKDRLNLSFVKDIYVVAKKMTRNCQKMAISETYFFLTKLKNTVDGNFLIYVIALDPIMI